MDRHNSLSAGVAGTSVTSANSGGASDDAFDVTNVLGMSRMTYRRTPAIGTMAIKHVVAPHEDAYYAWNVNLASQTTLYGRVYVWFKSFPLGGTARIVHGTNAGDTSFAIDVMSKGELRVVGSGGKKILFGRRWIAAGRWVRVEWCVDFATGVVEVRFYKHASSRTPTETRASPDGQRIGPTVDQIRFGGSAHQRIAATFWTDEPALSGEGFPGVA